MPQVAEAEAGEDAMGGQGGGGGGASRWEALSLVPDRAVEGLVTRSPQHAASGLRNVSLVLQEVGQEDGEETKDDDKEM